ncbi:MAG: SsrA-binding protein SmpB [Puniceicoccales bacterium]|jgi:SsrA-binding protein|nr:SsrA-binding protein SmpB [Puniceicoccales bacterium]
MASPKLAENGTRNGGGSVEVVNRKLGHRYEVLDRLDAGLVLRGTEVKSFRNGLAQISEAHVHLDRAGEVFLIHAHIDAYSHGTDANHDPVRPRKLLLHRKEILQLRTAVERKGMALVPARMHMAHGLVKVTVAICRGKKLRDRRQDLRTAVERREMDRALALRSKGKI